jgi:Na+/melibiose symporter-like transporter
MGLPLTTLGFVLALGLGWFLLGQSPRPSVTAFSVEETNRKLQQGLLAPWKNPEFQKLLSVFLLNGIAMAIPANLVIFFLTDRLKSPDLTPAALSIYFGSAALATPAWARLVKHLHLIKCWVLGMGLSVVTFAGAALLSEGDRTPFLIICALSGVALGADLALPAALLTGVIQKGGDQSREGAYFGWWNFANKLNLALAAGICLPILSVLGYQPGEQDPQALQALSVAYCAIPCLLKVCALCLLYRLFLRPLSNGEHQS